MTLIDAPTGTGFVMSGISLPRLDTRDWTKWHLEHPYEKKGWQSHITPEEYDAALKAGFKGWKDKSQAEFDKVIDKHGFGVKNSEHHLAIYNEAASRAYAEATKSGLTGQQMKWASTNKGTALAKKDKVNGLATDHAEHLGAAHGWAQAAVEQKTIEKSQGLGPQPSVSMPTPEVAPEPKGSIDPADTNAASLAKTLWLKDNGEQMNFGTQSGWHQNSVGENKPVSFYSAWAKLKTEKGWRKDATTVIPPEPPYVPKPGNPYQGHTDGGKAYNAGYSASENGEGRFAPPNIAQSLGKLWYQGYDTHAGTPGTVGDHTPLPHTGADLAKLTKIDGPLGSNGGQWYALPDGGKILVKPGQDADHVYNEIAVNSTYAVAGANVKETGAVKVGDDTMVVGRSIDPLTAITPQNVTPEDQAAAREHFGIDALTSNWDVFGLPSDPSGRNLFRSDTNKGVYRLDNGGGGFYRAQGSSKGEAFSEGDWAQNVTAGNASKNDYNTLLHSDQGKITYGNATKDQNDIQHSLDAAADLDLGAVNDHMADAGVPGPFRTKYLAVLEQRQNHLRNMGYGTMQSGDHPGLAKSFDAEHNEAMAHTKDNVPEATPEKVQETTNIVHQQGVASGLNVGKTMLANGKLPSEVHTEASILGSDPNSSINAQGYAQGMHQAAYELEEHPDFIKGQAFANGPTGNMISGDLEALSQKWAHDVHNSHSKEYKLGAAEAFHVKAESMKTGALPSTSAPTGPKFMAIKDAKDVKIGDKVHFTDNQGTAVGSSFGAHEVTDTYTTKSGKSTLLVTKDGNGVESEHMVPATNHDIIVHPESAEASSEPSYDRNLQTGPEDVSVPIQNVHEGDTFHGGYTIGDTFQSAGDTYAAQITGPHGTTYLTHPGGTTINKAIADHEANLSAKKSGDAGGNPYPDGSEESKQWAKGYALEGQYGLDHPEEVQTAAETLHGHLKAPTSNMDIPYKQGGLQAYKDQGAVLSEAPGESYPKNVPVSELKPGDKYAALSYKPSDALTVTKVEPNTEDPENKVDVHYIVPDDVEKEHLTGLADGLMKDHIVTVHGHEDVTEPPPSVASTTSAPKHIKTLASVQAKNIKPGDIVKHNGIYVKMDHGHGGSGPGQLFGHQVGPISGAVDLSSPKIGILVKGPSDKLQRITPAHPVWQAMNGTHTPHAPDGKPMVVKGKDIHVGDTISGGPFWLGAHITEPSKIRVMADKPDSEGDKYVIVENPSGIQSTHHINVDADVNSHGTVGASVPAPATHQGVAMHIKVGDKISSGGNSWAHGDVVDDATPATVTKVSGPDNDGDYKVTGEGIPDGYAYLNGSDPVTFHGGASTSPTTKTAGDVQVGDVIHGTTSIGGHDFGSADNPITITSIDKSSPQIPDLHGTDSNGSPVSYYFNKADPVTVHSGAAPTAAPAAPNRPNVKIGNVELTNEDAQKLKAHLENNLDSAGTPTVTVHMAASATGVTNPDGSSIEGQQWWDKIPKLHSDSDQDFLEELNKQLGNATPEPTPATGPVQKKVSDLKPGDIVSGAVDQEGNGGNGYGLGTDQNDTTGKATVISVSGDPGSTYQTLQFTKPNGVSTSWAAKPDELVTVHNATEGGTPITQPSSSVPKSGNKQAKVMAKNIKVGDQVLDKNGNMAGKVTKHNALQGSAGPHELTVEWSNGETSTQTAPEPTTKITKINPNHPKYIGGAPTSATSMGGVAVTSSSSGKGIKLAAQPIHFTGDTDSNGEMFHKHPGYFNDSYDAAFNEAKGTENPSTADIVMAQSVSSAAPLGSEGAAAAQGKADGLKNAQSAWAQSHKSEAKKVQEQEYIDKVASSYTSKEPFVVDPTANKPVPETIPHGTKPAHGTAASSVGYDQAIAQGYDQATAAHLQGSTPEQINGSVQQYLDKSAALGAPSDEAGILHQAHLAGLAQGAGKAAVDLKKNPEAHPNASSKSVVAQGVLADKSGHGAYASHVSGNPYKDNQSDDQLSWGADELSAVSTWKSKYRMSGKSSAYFKAVDNYTAGKSPGSGANAQSAKKIVDMYLQYAKPNTQAFQRKLSTGGMPASVVKELTTPGSTVDIPLTSWSTDPNAWSGNLWLHVPKGTVSMDMGKVANYDSEVETMSGGRYQVESVKVEGGTTHVYLKQTEATAA